MRVLKTALVLSVAMAFAGAAWACDKDKTTQANTSKKQTAQTMPKTQPVRDTSSKPSG